MTSKLWLPDDDDAAKPNSEMGPVHPFVSTHVNANSSTTANVPTIEQLQAIMAEFREKEREQLRRESQMIEDMECPVCKRKPTVTGSGFGKTYVVCPHLWDSIKKNVTPAEPMSRTPDGFPPIGFEPYGVRIEVLDDGPRRW